MAQKNRKARRAAGAEAREEAPPPAPSAPAPSVASTSWKTARFVLLVVAGVALVWWASNRPPPEGQVWNAAHGHYHSASGGELPAAEAEPPAGKPGQVWDPEHRHWHDAP